MDRNAAYRNRPVVLELRAFYGELQDIVLISMPPSPALRLTQTEHIILAGIQTCILEDHAAPRGLDIHCYTQMGRYEVVDMKNVQCLVGRVLDRGQWAIIDRSGGLARAMYDEEVGTN